MDEIEDPNRHQLACAARLLMASHPLAGAYAAQALEEGPPAAPGWYRRRSPLGGDDTYTFIGEPGQGGETRFSPPPGVPVAEDRPYRPLAQTEIWRIARALAAQLNQAELLERIEVAAVTSGDEAKAFNNAYIGSLAEEQARLGQAWLAWAPRTVVNDYLQFAIPGLTAAATLGGLLSTLAMTVCAQAGLERRAPVVRAALAAHYADMVYRLLRLRRGLNVTGYYQLSYLAELYGYTVATIAAGVLPGLAAEHQDAFQRLLLNNEERAAEQLAALSHALPARYSTVGVLMYPTRAGQATGQTLAEAVEAHKLHPALAAVFSAEAGRFSVSVSEAGLIEPVLAPGETLDDVQQRVQARYLAETRDRPGADLNALLEGEFNPLPERLGQMLNATDRAARRRAIRGWTWP